MNIKWQKDGPRDIFKQQESIDEGTMSLRDTKNYKK